MRNSVRTKLLSAFALVVACTAGVAVYGVYGDAQLVDALERLQQRGLVATAAVGTAGRLAFAIRSRQFHHAAETDAAQMREIEEIVAGLEGELDASLDRLESVVPEGDARRTRLRRARELIAAWRSIRNERFFPVSRTQPTAVALDTLESEVMPVLNRAIDELDALDDATARAARREYEQATEALERTRAYTVVAALLTALLALALGLLLARDIGRRVQQLAVSARSLAGGDLASRSSVSGSDEIGQLAVAFNQMAVTIEKKVETEAESASAQRAERDALARAVARYGAFVSAVARGELDQTLDESADTERLAALGRDLRSMGDALREMILNIHETVGSLSSSTAELTATSQEQSASAAEAAAAVTETVTTVDELTQMSRASAERAREVAESARRSLDASDAGRAAVEESIAAMDRVQTAMSAMAEQILGLSEQAQRVGQIVSAVGDLAEQSNLLALNATIEAARAGEHGRTFAVVAQEVRALAEQSKRATVQVREILGEIERSTTQAVLVTEEGGKAVSAAAETARDAGGRIDELSHVIAGSAEAARQIATSSEQQVTGVSQIAHAMHSINQASTQSVEATRQTERAARELVSLSERLREAVAHYRL